MVTFNQDVSSQTEAAEINRESPSIRHGVEIRVVDRGESFVDLEERSATCGLEQGNSENSQVSQIERRLADAQGAREQPTEVLDVPVIKKKEDI